MEMKNERKITRDEKVFAVTALAVKAEPK